MANNILYNGKSFVQQALRKENKEAKGLFDNKNKQTKIN